MTLKELRLAAFLTAEEAAQAIGVTTTTLSRWEHGAVPPRVKNIRAIAKAYKVDPQIVQEAITESRGIIK